MYLPQRWSAISSIRFLADLGGHITRNLHVTPEHVSVTSKPCTTMTFAMAYGVYASRKTKTEVHIHISKRADAIISKYRSIGSLLPSISSQKFNGYIKELGKVAKLDSPFRQVRRSGKTATEKRGPKWEFLSSHVARRTFVSISLERGMRHEVVMSFTDHRSFKTMKKYIALNEKGRKEDVERLWG